MRAWREPARPDSQRMKVAAFYSISNCQPGLRGVNLGNFLIKRVVEELRDEFPNLKTFCTLSPVPGFAHWLGHADELRSSRLKPAALASVQVWVKTGSIHEDAHLGAGLSHYLEHMLFKGTTTRSGRASGPGRGA